MRRDQLARAAQLPEPDVSVWTWYQPQEGPGIAVLAFAPRADDPLRAAPPLDDAEVRLLSELADPAARAVYADWLDDRGRTADAQYLRTQETLRAPVDPWAPGAAATAAYRALEGLVPRTHAWWRDRVARDRIVTVDDARTLLAGARWRLGTDAGEDPRDTMGQLVWDPDNLAAYAEVPPPLAPDAFSSSLTWALEIVRSERTLVVIENHARVLPGPHVIEPPIGAAESAWTISDRWNDQRYLARTARFWALFEWCTAA